MTPEIGDVLPTSPLVSKIGFTGSTAVGKMLAAKAMGTMKRVRWMEGLGHRHAVQLHLHVHGVA